MTRKEIITELKKYFAVSELVCNHTVKQFGELSWQFLDTELLHTILILRRDILGVAMVINHGGAYQRGLRCNLCKLVKDKTAKNEVYLSAHVNGAAIDFDAKGFTAEQARAKIKANANLLPYMIRLEKDVSWVHIDIYDNGSGQKVSEFNG